MQEIKITESVNSSQVRYNTTILKLRKILSITMMVCQLLLGTVQLLIKEESNIENMKKLLELQGVNSS